MRIIAGEWKGRRILAPPGREVRPTSDRAREAWMSIVHPRLPGARVVDLFAGTGALGLEALSRGAAHCDFVEHSARVAKVLRDNIATLGAGERATVHVMDSLSFVARCTDGAFDIGFADPPWRKGYAERVAELWLERPFATVLGVEHETAAPMPDGGETRRYGDTGITIYHRQTEGPPEGPSPSS